MANAVQTTSFSALSVLLLLCGSTLTAQEAPCQKRVLPVSFRDAENLPMQNVSVGDLEARVHGKPVKIISLASDTRPHRLVLILDTSGSMGSFDGESALWNLELSLGRHFYAMNSQKSQIALLLFNNQVTDTVSFDRGNPAVGDKLQEASTDRNFVKNYVKGKTALRDAILQGIKLISSPSSADAVLALTDGGDNASHESMKDLEERLAVTSVRLFAILLYREGYRNRTPEEVSGPDELSEVARKSGGEILTAAEWRGDHVALSANAGGKVKSEETLNRLYQAILQDNLLEIELPFASRKNVHWELKLSHAAHRKWRNAQIIYPDTLISCDAEVAGTGRN